RLALPMISHGPARYDPAELQQLNARLLHAMPYAAARTRLEELGLASEPLWLALRENLGPFGEAADLARLVRGPVTPRMAPAAREFTGLARDRLTPERWGEPTWADWTAALKERSGRKGRALFLPLRLALTGRPDGPELRSLLPLLGRKACLDRLS